MTPQWRYTAARWAALALAVTVTVVGAPMLAWADTVMITPEVFVTTRVDPATCRYAVTVGTWASFDKPVSYDEVHIVYTGASTPPGPRDTHSPDHGRFDSFTFPNGAAEFPPGDYMATAVWSARTGKGLNPLSHAQASTPFTVGDRAGLTTLDIATACRAEARSGTLRPPVGESAKSVGKAGLIG